MSRKEFRTPWGNYTRYRHSRFKRTIMRTLRPFDAAALGQAANLAKDIAAVFAALGALRARVVWVDDTQADGFR